MRTIKSIAKEIEEDWKVINNAAAQKALNHMKTMGLITEPFGTDSNGYAVVGSFLAHAIGWRGEVARRIKKELRQISGHPRP